MKVPRLPPGRVVVSLGGTLVVVFALAAGVVAAVGGGVGGIDPVASLVWRVGFCAGLLWVEMHRRRMRLFLVALGVSRRGVLLALTPVFAVLELLYRSLGGT